MIFGENLCRRSQISVRTFGFRSAPRAARSPRPDSATTRPPVVRLSSSFFVFLARPVLSASARYAAAASAADIAAGHEEPFIKRSGFRSAAATTRTFRRACRKSRPVSDEIIFFLKAKKKKKNWSSYHTTER